MPPTPSSDVILNPATKALEAARALIKKCVEEPFEWVDKDLEKLPSSEQKRVLEIAEPFKVVPPYKSNYELKNIAEMQATVSKIREVIDKCAREGPATNYQYLVPMYIHSFNIINIGRKPWSVEDQGLILKQMAFLQTDMEVAQTIANIDISLITTPLS